jgi:ABC-type branched-subunit amino acid transport system substrate-binding protein
MLWADKGGETMNARARRATRLVAVIAVLALALVACGRSSSSSNGGGGKKGKPATVAGFDGTTITVGAITPQTGIAQIIGVPLTNGNQAYFDAINATGGIAGKYKIKLDVRDSVYNTNTAQQNYNDLRENIVMLAQLLGTDITNAVLVKMKADKMVASPATLDAEWVRNPNLAPIDGPYQIQAINSISYWVDNGGKGKTLCVIRPDDLYGAAGFKGVEFASKNLDFKLGTVATFKASETDLSAQYQQVKGTDCDAVYFIALPTAAIPTLAKAAADNLDQRWIGQSPTWVSLLSEGATGQWASKHFWLAAEGPEWGDVSVPGMKQMLADVKKFKADQKPDIYFAFGYAQAWAVSQILTKAVANGDLSRAGIMKAMQDVGTLKFGGLGGDYKYGTAAGRVPPKTSTVFEVNPSSPGGLKAVKTNFGSPAAQKFQFPKS